MISIDPGVHGCGIAYWDGETLTAVAYGNSLLMASPVVIELPQVYMGSKSKGNPNDLIKLAFAAGRIVGALSHETVLPRQWKGTIKKDSMLRRILSKLDDRELALLKGLGLPPTKEHNVVDAIGIGLWKLGRL